MQLEKRVVEKVEEKVEDGTRAREEWEDDCDGEPHEAHLISLRILKFAFIFVPLFKWEKKSLEIHFVI